MKIKEKKSFVDRTLDNWLCLKQFLQKTGLRDTREREQEHRVIYVNNQKPPTYGGPEPLKYINNEIITSKYTLWNFLPKNLYEQFRRLANFYFLVNILVMLALPEPPKNPVTSMIPLTMVVLVTAIKQAYEDILRHKSDASVNNALVKVLRGGEFKLIATEKIICGDIVEVKTDRSFPCDILLMYSPTDDGTCHVTTANLDGETNLKLKSVPNCLHKIKSPSELDGFRGVIKCDKPNLDLYEFKGKIEINNHEYPLRNENVLLRGSTLKIAPVVYGCAIYTGKDTKLMLNSKFKSNKLSCVERTLNRFILFFLGLLLLYTLICVIGSFFYMDLFEKHWYLSGREPRFFTSQIVVYYIIETLFYITMFSNIIPISMYISIETQRFIGTKFFEWDIKMFDPKTNQTGKANTSDLNEDLGQIEYLFSDKTGTLTENEMIFKQLSIDGVLYEARADFLYNIATEEPASIDDPKIVLFLEILSVCHTVQLDRMAKEMYQASSPDEFSFIKFCQRIGVVFEGDSKEADKQYRTVMFFNQVEKYEILNILEFDSTRKRMSVILRNAESNEIVLYCKGAENAIFAKCAHGTNIGPTNESIDKFAEQGWRTLAFAYRKISDQDYESYNKSLQDAYNDLDNRDELLVKIYEEIESDLVLIGATAVEDRLQEEVPQTLEALRQAGIKIWVLTGDKKETAINISDSCKHFSKDMNRLVLTEMKDAERIKEMLELHLDKLNFSDLASTPFAYIVDGQTLGCIFKYKLNDLFSSVCMKCTAVLCCRMSPSQKAQIVKLVKTSKKKPITCAIGDGANDVSMIQEAHIGFGIYGKEGRNAARSSDFAFAKFKHARRALLVHGYLYYTRLTTLVHYFFYKNVVFVTCQLFYAYSTAFSVQALFPTIFMIFYNIFFTSVPIITYGIFEQRTSIAELEREPTLYKTIRKNKLLSITQFLKWNFLGIWHALVCYFLTLGLYGNSISLASNGLLYGNAEFGSMVVLNVILVVHLKLLIEWHSINFITILSILCSILGLVIWCLIPNSFVMPFPLTIITEDQSLLWSFYQILSYPSLWLAFLLTSGTALLPDVLIKTFENLVDKNHRLGRETSFSNLKDACLSDKARKAKEEEKANMTCHVNTIFTNDEDENGFEISRRYKNNEDDVVSSSCKSSIYQYGYKNPRGLYDTAKLSARVYNVQSKSRSKPVTRTEIRI